MTKYKIMDGNEACATASYLFTESAGIYPITPASPMAEHVDKMSSKGRKNFFGTTAKVIEMQNEKGAAGLVHGLLQAGNMTTTYTASQGLLLMLPNMYKIAGELLPGVIHVASRTLATHALSILGDHSDIYTTLSSGFCMLASSNANEVMKNAAVAHLSAVEGSLPFLHFFDGFRTSHELSKVELLDEEYIKSLLNKEKVKEFRQRALPFNNVTRGTAQNDDIFFQASEVRNNYYDKIPDIVNDYMEKVCKDSELKLKPFNYYGVEDPEKVIVAMGSISGTIKTTINYLKEQGEKVGLLEVHLFRPFSKKYFLNEMPKTVKKIAVLDRAKTPGNESERLYLDVLNIYSDEKEKPIILGGSYGLSGKDSGPKEIKAVYDFLDNENNFNNFTVGIEDDKTNKSIPINQEYTITNDDLAMLIYGYGSDGMTSGSKNLLKIIGNNEGVYVNGYFQYDSKKSGGITRAHLRFSNTPITSTHYVKRPQVVVCTKEAYLDKYEILEGIRENGIFFINSEEASLPEKYKEIIEAKNIKVFQIDADKIAEENGLKEKIGTIMQLAIFKLTNIIPYETAKQLTKDYIEKSYQKAGKEVIESNFKALDSVEQNINQITKENIKYKTKGCPMDCPNKVTCEMNLLKGDNIKVSEFNEMADGTFEGGLTQFEKRKVNEKIIVWDKNKCIECGKCSLACPHAVIRPFLLDESELKNAPTPLDTKPGIGNEYHYIMAVSHDDCTGCQSCVNVCPVGALTMVDSDERRNSKETINYLFNEVTNKKVAPKDTVKGSQFEKPLFEFSGACAGCGETPYIKLLTQIVGEKLVIANATGCSSIYGASAPSTPYKIPWANSLFEDNAEYGYGIGEGYNTKRDHLFSLIEELLPNAEENLKPIYQEIINNINNEEKLIELKATLETKNINEELKELIPYMIKKSTWILGGDGWAYDIDFDGIDHVLSKKENINILVLDSEVYSNTGGQSSKSTPAGMVAKFAASGKKEQKKNMARHAMCYPHVYVGSISIGGNMAHAIKTIKEAEEYDGPSIIIAYTPCIAHGIKGGMGNSIEREKLATECGYFPIFNYYPITKEFKLLTKEPKFDLYEEFLLGERRYEYLKEVNPEEAETLFKQNKDDAIERFEYYKNLDTKKETA